MRSTESPPSRPTILDLWWPIVLPVALSLLSSAGRSPMMSHVHQSAGRFAAADVAYRCLTPANAAALTMRPREFLAPWTVDCGLAASNER
jgi:hypothetical protein